MALMGERRRAYRVLLGGKRQFGRPKHRWDVILKWFLRKEVRRVWGGLIWLDTGEK